MAVGLARLFAVVLVLNALSPPALAAVRTIALVGDDAIGTGEDANFSSFSMPSLNNRGQVAFAAQLAGADVTTTNRSGYWIASDGETHTVARAGAAAPGMPAGTTFGTLNTLFNAQAPINDTGEIAFRMSATQTSGLWIGDHESLSLLAKQGDVAPGAENNSIFSGFSSAGPALNRRGDVAFTSYLNGEPYNSVNSNNYHDGVWVLNRDGLVTSVLAGRSLPALAAEAQLIGFNTSTRLSLNRFGEAAFVANHKLNPSATLRPSVWIASGDEIDLRAHAEQPLPGIDDSATVNFLTHPGFNSAGTVVMEASFSAPSGSPTFGTAILHADAGDLTPVAFAGGPAPGLPGHVISDTNYEPSLGSGGHMAFFGRETGEGSIQRTGVWAGRPDELRTIVMQGDAVPNANATFGSFFRSTPGVNRFGQVAFPAGLIDSQGGGTSSSLWATDLDGELMLIARAGTTIEVAAGDVRTISTVSMLANYGDDDGRPRGMNDLGQIVFLAQFTNGTNGIFMSDAVAHLPGDYNSDGIVDTGDYLVWRTAIASQNLVADGDRDGIVGESDHALWSEFFGMSLALDSGSGGSSIPEPVAAPLVAICCATLLLYRRSK